MIGTGRRWRFAVPPGSPSLLGIEDSDGHVVERRERHHLAVRANLGRVRRVPGGSAIRLNGSGRAGIGYRIPLSRFRLGAAPRRALSS
jgi:hypothetical protein